MHAVLTYFGQPCVHPRKRESFHYKVENIIEDITTYIQWVQTPHASPILLFIPQIANSMTLLGMLYQPISLLTPSQML